ncbi:MAG: hypothetical protein WCT27_03925 [Patescibacteria group bacterium]
MKNVTDVFFDVDYTIADFGPAQRQALDVMVVKYGRDFTEHFGLLFHTILEGLRAKQGHWDAVPGGQAAYLSLRERMTGLVPSEKPQIWSRELYALLAGEYVGKPLTPVACLEVAETYWSACADFCRPFSDAVTLAAALERRGVRYHFFTSSDFRLVFRNGQWQYDPVYSEEKKLPRILRLGKFGVHPTSISIGDPIDKPELEFYRKVLATAEQMSKATIDVRQCMFIGDSFAGDVQVPVERLGANFGFWLQRDKPACQISEKIRSVSSLDEIQIYLE